jgi:hypothetical protein
MSDHRVLVDSNGGGVGGEDHTHLLVSFLMDVSNGIVDTRRVLDDWSLNIDMLWLLLGLSFSDVFLAMASSPLALSIFDSFAGKNGKVLLVVSQASDAHEVGSN